MRIGAVIVLMTFPLTTGARRIDEYLQAARLSLALDRIVLKMDLTPGIDVAPLIFARINTNRDGRISEAEGRVYANHVLEEIVLEVDGKPGHLDLVSAHFPSFEEMNAGTGVIRIEAHARWTGGAGQHSLFYRNNHMPELGAYLVNALVPAGPEIEILDQHRDPLQREFRLGFRVAVGDFRRE